MFTRALKYIKWDHTGLLKILTFNYNTLDDVALVWGFGLMGVNDRVKLQSVLQTVAAEFLLPVNET